MKDKKRNLYPEFDGMSSHELEAMLKAELDRENPDREKALQLLDILETRDRTSTRRSGSGTAKRRTSASWLRKAAVVAAILLVFAFAAPPVFGAENIVELVGRWTQELFALIRQDSQEDLQCEYVFNTNHPGLQQVYDAVVAQGITQRVVPGWVPEECALDNIKVIRTPNGMQIHANLGEGRNYITLLVVPSNDAYFLKFPKDDVDSQIWEISGKKHYVVQNDGDLAIVWEVDSIVCSITTTYSNDIVLQIIQSIYQEGT